MRNATKPRCELERLLGRARCAVALGVIRGNDVQRTSAIAGHFSRTCRRRRTRRHDIVAAGAAIWAFAAEYASGRAGCASACRHIRPPRGGACGNPWRHRPTSPAGLPVCSDDRANRSASSARRYLGARRSFRDRAYSGHRHGVTPARSRAALCDTLEAAIREVGDAIVRNDAAAARAQGATALLGDLARRVTDLIALAASVEEPAREPGRPVVEVAAPNGEADWFDNAFDRSVTDSPALSRPASSMRSCPMMMSLPCCLDRHARTFTCPRRRQRPYLAKFHQIRSSPGPSALTRQGSLSRSNSIAPGFAASLEPEATASAATSLPQPSVDERPPPQPDSRAALNDPLTALHALSEEELIALFS